MTHANRQIARTQVPDAFCLRASAGLLWVGVGLRLEVPLGKLVGPAAAAREYVLGPDLVDARPALRGSSP